MKVLSLLDEIAKRLEQEQDTVRIKKLMYCAYCGSWENNLNTINNFSFGDLIQELLKAYPTISQLSSQLYSIANNLSRSEVYSLIAGKIISQLSTVYEQKEKESNSQLIPENQANPQAELIFDEVISRLYQDTNATRIKKLMFCVCTGNWENDLNVLAGFSYKKLLQDLLKFYPTMEQLNQVIYSIVNSLSRPVIYSDVAQTLLSQVSKLYYQVEGSAQITQELPLQPEQTQLVTSNNEEQENDTGEDSELRLPVIDEQATELKRKQTDNLDSTQIVAKQTKVYQQQIRANYDTFELRIDLMKYTNPLRAKVLLFSLLYHNFQGEQDWLEIKNHELDDLLLKTFLDYQSFPKLESQLYQTANQLEESDEYTQAASAICQSIAAIYQNRHNN